MILHTARALARVVARPDSQLSWPAWHAGLASQAGTPAKMASLVGWPNRPRDDLVRGDLMVEMRRLQIRSSTRYAPGRRSSTKAWRLVLPPSINDVFEGGDPQNTCQQDSLRKYIFNVYDFRGPTLLLGSKAATVDWGVGRLASGAAGQRPSKLAGWPAGWPRRLAGWLAGWLACQLGQSAGPGSQAARGGILPSVIQLSIHLWGETDTSNKLGWIWSYGGHLGPSCFEPGGDKEGRGCRVKKEEEEEEEVQKRRRCLRIGLCNVWTLPAFSQGAYGGKPFLGTLLCGTFSKGAPSPLQYIMARHPPCYILFIYLK